MRGDRLFLPVWTGPECIRTYIECSMYGCMYVCMHVNLHLHSGHLADAFIQSDLQ